MATILAIDPGTTHSGWCLLYSYSNGVVVPAKWGWDDNVDIVITLQDDKDDKFSSHRGHLDFGDTGYERIAIEDVSHYGMPVGKDVFDTVRWTGRFQQASLVGVTYIKRPDIKLYLCGSARANDSTIRQAIIDRFGGDEVAIGGKKCKTCKGKGWVGRGRPACPDCEKQVHQINGEDVERGSGYQSAPGVLHGISGHVWSALAVGLTHLKQPNMDFSVLEADDNLLSTLGIQTSDLRSLDPEMLKRLSDTYSQIKRNQNQKKTP